MARSARLITPRGKTIDLPDEIYRQVKEWLTSRNRRRSRARFDEAIKACYGKYAGGKSLTQALLAERAEYENLVKVHESTIVRFLSILRFTSSIFESI